jgi:AraC-like DNA-binding protein
MNAHNWIDLQQDPRTGIETLRAHFKGHAYDPHWHDSYLVGFTEQGVQQFHCGRQKYSSTPGQIFLLEPGDIHDGDAPTEDGFTYRMLYLEQQWLERALCQLFEQAPEHQTLAFAHNQTSDAQLQLAISDAFAALHSQELLIVRESALDRLLERLTAHLHWRARHSPDPRLPLVALRARDYLHAHVYQDVGLEELAQACNIDRFRLTRAFKAAFGLPPHAYLVQLRLAKARRLLASGEFPAQVASDLGFADQSHLGRWFLRAYGISPAAYRKRCSNLPD